MGEHEEQAFVINWAGLLERKYPPLQVLHAIPNGAKLPWRRVKGKRFSPEAMKLIAEGLKKGVPDLSLPYPNKGYHGLYMEAKFGKNKPTPEQEWWLDRLTEYGYLAVPCWGAMEMIEVLKEYLDITE